MKKITTLKLQTNVFLAFLYLIILGGTTPLFAQESTGKVNGKVIDEGGKAVDYATVTLANSADSSLVKVLFSDEQGNYTFDQIKDGNYFVQAEMLGFGKGISESFQIKESNHAIKLKDITLSVNNKELETIVITARKPLIERRADMLVVNVENSTLAAGNNALEILERSPGITVDKDDNISLNGKQGIMVMIDGKETHLSSTQLANLLRSTDGNTLQSVEIINNPSAKYDAAGGSGIINIKLKKNKVAGTNGTFNLGGGHGNGFKGNTSLNINHKKDNVSLFGTYSYQTNDRTDLMDINRIVGQDANFTSFDQNNSMNNQYGSHSLRTGVDLQTSDKNTISLQLSGLLNNSDAHNISNVQIGSYQSSLDSTLTANSLFRGEFKNYSINLNNTYNIDTLGSKISADVDISAFFDDNSADYGNFFYKKDGSEMHDPLLLKSYMPSTIRIQSFKTDYTRPFNENSGLEAGLKYANVKTDNNLKFSEFINENWENVANRSNHFIYTERVAAAYLNYHTKFNKLGIQTGLRTEYTTSNGNSITLGNEVKRDYVDFFPNISLSYDLSENNQFSLSYSKRINRPPYGVLNPFNYFLDKYTYQQGNPYLQPEYIHAFGLNYTLMKRYNISTGYEIRKDAIVEIMKQNDVDKTTLVTNENIAQQEQWFINVNAPVKFTKFWSSNTNVTTFYLGFKSKQLESPINYGQLAFQGTSNHTFQLLPTLSADATLNYQSGLRYSIYKIGQAWSMDLGINKSFRDKRANVKLSVSDIFDTRTQSVSTQYANLNTNINQRRESRIVRLSLSYSFGNTKISGPKQNAKSDEENRVGK
ncbi:outer membrane beta-barrel family protein [Albibacterium sp.]|uniref:outer membrane beta-barrel family protein n=1 Tax=Albibacterium sp. TaxID=2952885 RepID=UPI002CC9EE4C|nr:outer membrane beta-barrel family protein [Albibacterium sp.]HUH20156.1 outer membrane beta-barrel family protein [Albibacterium sp.]